MRGVGQEENASRRPRESGDRLLGVFLGSVGWEPQEQRVCARATRGCVFGMPDVEASLAEQELG